MATEKPTIVIFPGAWHPPPLYEPFGSTLQAAGYPTVILYHPSLDPSPPVVDVTCRAVTQAARTKVLPLIERDGKDIIIIAHSWGGVPAGGCAYGLSKTVRQQSNQKGGVIGLIYISGAVVPEGPSLFEYLGGKHGPFVVRHMPVKGVCIVDEKQIIPVFFHDVEDTKAAESMAAQLVPHSLAATESPSPPPGWGEAAYKGRLGYIKTLQDRCFPSPLQDMFIARSQGPEWMLTEMDTGHNPFCSKPDELFRIVEEYVEIFQKVEI